MVLGPADDDVVMSGLGVKLCCGHQTGCSYPDGARLVVAVLARAVGGAVRVDLAEVASNYDTQRPLFELVGGGVVSELVVGVGVHGRGRGASSPADGPAVVRHRAIAPPRERRARSHRDAVGSRAALAPGPADDDGVQETPSCCWRCSQHKCRQCP